MLAKSVARVPELAPSASSQGPDLEAGPLRLRAKVLAILQGLQPARIIPLRLGAKVVLLERLQAARSIVGAVVLAGVVAGQEAEAMAV